MLTAATVIAFWLLLDALVVWRPYATSGGRG